MKATAGVVLLIALCCFGCRSYVNPLLYESIESEGCVEFDEPTEDPDYAPASLNLDTLKFDRNLIIWFESVKPDSQTSWIYITLGIDNTGQIMDTTRWSEVEKRKFDKIYPRLLEAVSNLEPAFDRKNPTYKISYDVVLMIAIETESILVRIKGTDGTIFYDKTLVRNEGP